MIRKNMLLVFNPKAGKGEFGLNLFEVVDLFTANGYVVTTYPTQAEKEALAIIAQRGTDYDSIVCAGGDGTLNEAISGLMSLPEARRPAFGYLPCGTTNDFATSLALPRDVLQAARIVVEGQTREIDIGCFGDCYFSYVAAFGMFTSIPYDTAQERKNVLGHAAYVLEGIKQLGSIKAYECTVRLDSREFTDRFILGIISNSTSVGGFKLFSDEKIRMDDGAFEFVFLKQPESLLDLQNIVASLLGRPRQTNSILAGKASRIEISSPELLSWTLDGEFGGKGVTALIENRTRALRILAPAVPE